MNKWFGWSLVGVALALLALVAFLAYRGLRSRLRPFLIFRTAWSLALTRFWAAPGPFLGLAFVIASGAALQVLFTFWHGLDDRTLLFASVAWQGVMAIGVAVFAAPLQLLVVHDFLEARRFGADTMFYRGDAVNQALPPRSPPLSLLLRAAIFGFLIWLLAFALQMGTNAAVLLAPGWIRSAVPEIVRFVSPRFVQIGAFISVSFVSFVILTFFCLLRPALALGSKRPVSLGLRMAAKNLLALYAVSGLLLVAPAIMGPALSFVPHYFLGTSLAGKILGDAAFLIFSLFQTLSVETTTLLFLSRAINADADERSAEPASKPAH